MSREVNLPRRRFLSTMAAGVAAIPLASLLTRNAEAADLPHVDPKDATATAIGYVDDAAKIDAKKETLFKAGSHCGSCALFQGGTAEFGPCPIFPGKAVHSKGWCRSYVAKA